MNNFYGMGDQLWGLPIYSNEYIPKERRVPKFKKNWVNKLVKQFIKDKGFGSKFYTTEKICYMMNDWHFGKYGLMMHPEVANSITKIITS